jgi:hypothetical protein
MLPARTATPALRGRSPPLQLKLCRRRWLDRREIGGFNGKLSQEKIGGREPDEIDKVSGAAAICKAWRRISDTTSIQAA